jgi:pyridoxamine 5'-phosphate oxidase family protein
LEEAVAMSVFSPSELDYLAEGAHLGRLATVDPTGLPHVVPLGWTYNPDLDTIDIGGRDETEFLASRKFRNVKANAKVAFIVDDVLPPFRPRAVEVRGEAEAIHHPAKDGADATFLIRIRPAKVTSWGLRGGNE